MATTISPQMRIVALCGVLLVALAGAGLLVLRHHKPGTATGPSTPRVQTTATTQSARRPSASPTRLRVVKPRVDPSLPAPLRAALERQRFVVVALYDPQVRVDSLTVTEARAGAQEANAGFLRVNLLDDRVAGTLTALLPAGSLLPAPGILVYRRPGTLVYRFDGYLDRDGVAQAVADVK